LFISASRSFGSRSGFRLRAPARLTPRSRPQTGSTCPSKWVAPDETTRNPNPIVTPRGDVAVPRLYGRDFRNLACAQDFALSALTSGQALSGSRSAIASLTAPNRLKILRLTRRISLRLAPQGRLCGLPLGHSLAHAAQPAQDPSARAQDFPSACTSGQALRAPGRRSPPSRPQNASNCQRPLRTTAPVRPGAMARISRRPEKASQFKSSIVYILYQ